MLGVLCHQTIPALGCEFKLQTPRLGPTPRDAKYNPREKGSATQITSLEALAMPVECDVTASRLSPCFFSLSVFEEVADGGDGWRVRECSLGSVCTTEV